MQTWNGGKPVRAERGGVEVYRDLAILVSELNTEETGYNTVMLFNIKANTAPEDVIKPQDVVFTETGQSLEVMEREIILNPGLPAYISAEVRKL